MPATEWGGRWWKETSDPAFHTSTKVTTTPETEIGEVLHKVGYCKKIVAKS